MRTNPLTRSIVQPSTSSPSNTLSHDTDVSKKTDAVESNDSLEPSIHNLESQLVESPEPSYQGPLSMIPRLEGKGISKDESVRPRSAQSLVAARNKCMTVGDDNQSTDE